ncbi:MAG: Polymyxin resistance protein ArnT, undecaprenyl phosphate-alpha-L-Ara4N transferase, partial [Labilithrix sp.]|nr:Polymyxin resistance protein ArnT, undecaprenyl phosphate-alpha-L-Ara4N transferase [Labilithrix sp.]
MSEMKPNGDPEPVIPDEKPVPTTAEPELAAAPAPEPVPEPTEPDVIPRGNPLRLRALLTIAAGGIPAFLLMAKNSQNTWGVPLGLLFVLVATWGIMDLLGTFDDADDKVVGTTELGVLARPLAVMVVVFGLFCGSISLAQSAALPWWFGSIAVTGTFLGLVAAVFAFGRTLGPWKHDELGLDRGLLHRHGFWVLAVGALLYFPAMGLQSLWDPWETHYGEVAREIVSRDDWISLWWAQDGWFFSKPILNFWIQSLAMASLGTHVHPDMMLTGANGAWTAHPEWVVRTPNVLMTLVAMYLLYKGVAKVFGRRAGLFGAIVLATLPDWFFLAHQTMTDMPFVAAMTGAMGLLLNGLNTHEDELVRTYEIRAFGRSFRVSLWHVVFGAVILCALPQILYLMSRNLELVVWGDGPKGFRVHWDEFRSGSAGNCGLPGNEACVMHSPASVPKSTGANPVGLGASLVRYFAGFEPSLQGIAWGGVLAGLLYVNWGERRTRRILYVSAWLCAAIATMAKGPAGFGLPMICAFAYVATKRRWSELLRLELLSGVLVILAVAIPWYVAMYVRHGSPFTDRIIFHDMFNRAFSHVHDTNEGDDTGIRFYLWQLGYALFPWTGLVPLGLIWGFRRSDSAISRLWTSAMRKSAAATGANINSGEPNINSGEGTAVGDAAVMLVMWFLFAFFLFTFMGTKFHHYIFPAVPPAAMLVGVVLDDVLGERPLVKRGLMPVYAVGLGLGAAIATYGASRAWPGSVFGAAPGAGAEGHFGLAVIIGFVGLAVTALVAFALRSPQDGKDVPGRRLSATPDVSPYRGGVKVEGETVEESRRRSHEQLMVAGAALLGAFVLVLVGRDLVIKPEGADQPGAIRLLQLFTYNYRRAWPDALDFAGVLGGFTVVGAILSIGIGIRATRRHAVAAFCAFALVWAVWGLDVYMVKTSPHWGQHEVIEAYYKDRKGPEEQLVAYQMNWKGENFYTGNHVPAFVSSGATFQSWLKTQKEQKG